MTRLAWLRECFGRLALFVVVAGLSLALAVGGLLDGPAQDDSPAARPAAPWVPPLPAPAAGRLESSAAAVPPLAAPSAAAPRAEAADAPPPRPARNWLAFVHAALAGNAAPEEALMVADLLKACKNADATVEFMFRMRDDYIPERSASDRPPPEQINERLEHMQAHQRRCQVFDAFTLAREGELLARAFDSGVQGAALRYLEWLNGDGKPTASAELTARVQREVIQAAQDGDSMALFAITLRLGDRVDVTPVQRQGFSEATRLIWLETVRRARAVSGQDAEEEEEEPPNWDGELSAEERREAEALAAKTLAAWRRRNPG